MSQHLTNEQIQAAQNSQEKVNATVDQVLDVVNETLGNTLDTMLSGTKAILAIAETTIQRQTRMVVLRAFSKQRAQIEILKSLAEQRRDQFELDFLEMEAEELESDLKQTLTTRCDMTPQTANKHLKVLTAQVQRIASEQAPLLLNGNRIN